MCAPSVRFLAGSRRTVTVAAYASQWLAGAELAATSRTGYAMVLRRYINPRFGSRALSSVTKREVRDWFRELSAGTPSRKGVAKPTIAKIRTVGSSMYAFALEDDPPAAEHNPFSGHRIKIEPKPRRILTRAEFDALLAAIEGETAKLLLRLGINTGLRWGEMTALAPGDIQGNVIIVRHSRDRFGNIKGTKSVKFRRVHIEPAFAGELRQRLPLLTSATGTPLRHDNFFERTWKPARDKAGLGADVTPHCLKHTHASWLAATGLALSMSRAITPTPSSSIPRSRHEG